MITSIGATKLCEAVISRKVIKTLGLSGNNFDPSISGTIMRMTKTLHTFYLSMRGPPAFVDNCGLGSEGIKEISEIAGSSGLRLFVS